MHCRRYLGKRRVRGNTMSGFLERIFRRGDEIRRQRRGEYFVGEQPWGMWVKPTVGDIGGVLGASVSCPYECEEFFTHVGGDPETSTTKVMTRLSEHVWARHQDEIPGRITGRGQS